MHSDITDKNIKYVHYFIIIIIIFNMYYILKVV